MKLQSLSKMPFSSGAAWPEVAILDKEIAKVFLYLVAPFSLLPPAMLALAGIQYGNGLSDSYWSGFAVVFFFAEIASVSLMSWLIEYSAKTYHEKISYRNSYLLAAIAPIPLWLSSLGLLVPSLMFNAVASFVALCLSCGLVYHGVRSFCNIREGAHAGAITRVVFGAGLVAWAALLMLLFHFSGITAIPGTGVTIM